MHVIYINLCKTIVNHLQFHHKYVDTWYQPFPNWWFIIILPSLYADDLAALQLSTSLFSVDFPGSA